MTKYRNEAFTDDDRPRGRAPRGGHPRRRGDRGAMMGGMGPERDGRGGGKRRARRGMVGASVLFLLSESDEPMHGYELITALEERSGGRWRPSPGSIYPALARLEDGGFIEGEDDDDKRRYSLTDAGRERLSRFDREDLPWSRGLGGGNDGRRAMAELGGLMRQIGRFGTDEQRLESQRVVGEATQALYRLLAEGAGNPTAEPVTNDAGDGDDGEES